MICPLCGSTVYPHQISRRMSEIAKRPRSRPLIRGTLAAKERARKVVLVRWQRVQASRKIGEVDQ
jgi:hypothetical protein